MVEEFREFITRGNLVTLAVGFIMGVAFSTLVTSFVENLIMPVVAIPFGKPNFDNLVWEVNGSVIAWGAFLTTIVVFLLTALAVFLFIVKPYNVIAERIARPDDDQPGPTEIELLTQIRDHLAARS